MGNKVIHIVNDLPVGGVSAVLYDLLKNHTASNFSYEIVNLSGRYDDSIVLKFKELEIPIHNLDYQFEEGYTLFHQFRKAFFKSKFINKNKRIINYIANLNPMILHFHTLPRELMLGSEIIKLRRSEIIYTDHLVRVKQLEIKRISKNLIGLPLKRYYKGVYVIAVSNAVANYLKNFKISKVLAGLKVIPNKITDNTYRIPYVEKLEYKVVYVARISLVKGHKDLIEAWRALPQLNLNLYIIGPDEMNGSIQKMTKEGTFGNKITFTGAINNVSEFIKDADIGVFPSYKEGLPIALLEKMQIGIPCIVSNIDELTSIVTHNKNGLVYTCKDSRDLAGKIIALVQDINLRKALGTNAAQLIKEEFVSKIGGIDKEYEKIYYEILKIG